MKFFATVLSMLVAAASVRLLVKYGTAVSPVQQADLVAAGVALASILIHAVAATPVYATLKGYFKSQPEAATLQRVSPEVVDLIAKAVMAELAQHIKRPTTPAEPAGVKS